MSAEVIIIIVGIVFLLLAVGDGMIAKDSSEGWVNNKLRIPLGVLGLLLIIYGGSSYGAVNLVGQIEQADIGNVREVEGPVSRVLVTSPIEGDEVSCRILTMGVYPEAHQKDIWVVVKPSDNRYYPQSDHTNTSYKRNGEWQVITRFGGDQGESYEIIIYEAGAAASEFFSNTIADWKAAGAYPGLEEDAIPRGADEVDRIVVSMAENCRGVH